MRCHETDGDLEMLEWKQVPRAQEGSGSKENYLGDICKRDVAKLFAKHTVIASE